MRAHVAVLGDARARRDELADHDVLLQTAQVVAARLDGGLGEHLRGRLERRRRQPRIGGQGGFSDAHQLGAPLRRALLLGDESLVGVAVAAGVHPLAGQEVRVAGLLHQHAAGHLADDQLDVLVVDRHALLAVHRLHLVHQVLLHGAQPFDLEQLLRVHVALDEHVPRLDLVAVGELEPGADDGEVLLLGPVGGDDPQALLLRVGLVYPQDPRTPRQGGLALGGASLEQLHDAGQAAGDVADGPAQLHGTAGVEGPHRELGARLADGLGGDHAHRLARLDEGAGGERHAVGLGGDAVQGVVGQRRQDPHPLERGVALHLLHQPAGHHLTGRHAGTVLEHDPVGQHPAQQPDLEGPVGGTQIDVDPRGGLAVLEGVLVVDDELLGDVHEAAREIARVGGAQRRVDEALAGARRGDEVLQHRQPLAIVRLDRAGDHVAARVGHHAAHPGDLAELHHVAAGARVHHHADGVELLAAQQVHHGVLHLLGGLQPGLDLLLAALAVGDDPAEELLLGGLRPALVLVQDLRLVGRDLDVVQGDREPRLRGEAETQILQTVEAARHDRLGVVARQALHQPAHGGPPQLLVDVAEVVGELLVQQDAPHRRGLIARPGAVGVASVIVTGVAVGGAAVGGAAVGGLGAAQRGDPVLHRSVEPHRAALEGEHDLVAVPEDPPGPAPLGVQQGQVVRADDHVLGGRD